MSADCSHTFNFGGKHVIVDENDFYDLIFEDQYEFCRWLLRHDGWRYLDHACEMFHPNHVAMLGEWAIEACADLPDEIRNPVDGTVRDQSSLIRFLAGALPWMVANGKLTAAHNEYLAHAPTVAAEEAVRVAARDLIDAALGYPPPYREVMVRRSLVWADFVDRRWLQGLNIPPPWRLKRPPLKSPGD